MAADWAAAGLCAPIEIRTNAAMAAQVFSSPILALIAFNGIVLHQPMSVARAARGIRVRRLLPDLVPVFVVPGAASACDAGARHRLTTEEQVVWTGIRAVIVGGHHFVIGRGAANPARCGRAGAAVTFGTEQPNRAGFAGHRPGTQIPGIALHIGVA